MFIPGLALGWEGDDISGLSRMDVSVSAVSRKLRQGLGECGAYMFS